MLKTIHRVSYLFVAIKYTTTPTTRKLTTPSKTGESNAPKINFIEEDNTYLLNETYVWKMRSACRAPNLAGLCSHTEWPKWYYLCAFQLHLKSYLPWWLCEDHDQASRDPDEKTKHKWELAWLKIKGKIRKKLKTKTEIIINSLDHTTQYIQ